MSRPSALGFERRFHVALYYHVLSHLALGPDAASLHRPESSRPGWASDLEAAYLTAPGRITAQFVPLWTHDLEATVDWLRHRDIDGLLEPADKELCERLAEVLELEFAEFQLHWERDRDAANRLLRERAGRLSGPLMKLRSGIWNGLRSAPPPLRVLDVPAMGRSGRAVGRERRLVAVSLAEPLEHVLCQIFHEETHVASDPAVMVEMRDAAPRDTRAGAVGHAMHRALETAAVNLGEELIRKRAPELRGAYQRWRARYGM